MITDIDMMFPENLRLNVGRRRNYERRVTENILSEHSEAKVLCDD